MDKGKAPLIEEEGKCSSPSLPSPSDIRHFIHGINLNLDSLTEDRRGSGDGGLVSMFFRSEKFPLDHKELLGSSSKGVLNDQLQTIAVVPMAASDQDAKRIQSLDDSSSNKPKLMASSSEPPSAKGKAKADERLAEIALVDAKRAKRLISNRQAAARSKEKKLKQEMELEHKLQHMEAHVATLSNQLTMLEQESFALASENYQLMLQLDKMQEHVRLHTALGDAMQGQLARIRAVEKRQAKAPFTCGTWGFYGELAPQPSWAAGCSLRNLQFHSGDGSPADKNNAKK